MKDTSDLPSYRIEEFEEDQEAAAEDPTGQWFMRDQPRPTAIDAIAEVSSWHGYSEEYLRKIEEDVAEGEQFPSPWNEPDIAFKTAT